MSQHIRILMVEDSANDAVLIERELRRAHLNFSLQRVHTEQDLRAALESMDPDVILGDYNLPGFDGIEALKVAVSLVPDTPYIFVSGSIGEERAVQTLREGATDYLLKDRLSRLASAITRAVDQSRDRRLRRRAQEALLRMSRQHSLILNSAAEGIIGVDRNGTTLVANAAAAKMTGYTVEEMMSAGGVHDLLHHSHSNGEPFPAGDCPIMRATREGVSVTPLELFFWRKSGEMFPAECACSPIVEHGEITGSVITFQDITERKRLEARMQQTQRVAGLGRVAATIAHEFNNVLMGIQPFAEIIRRNNRGESIEKATTHILNSVARGRRVTQEILRFTQPAEPALQPVDLREWIQLLIPELQAMIGDRIPIVLEAAEEPVIVACDAVQMQQVVSNLVLNARDAMPDGGSIRVSISMPEDVPGMASIRVSDTGVGMMPEVLQNIFEPLYTTKRSGTGLGLAVAQQIVHRHGGSIQVQSTPGEGSLFSILLPLSKQARKKSETAPGTRSKPRSVLLVEDDAQVAAGLIALLEMERIRVDWVKLGAKAIDAIEACAPETVILDLTLPDMSGMGVYEEISRHWPALPVIFSSGHADASMLDGLPGHVAFLRKPYDLGTLMETLEKVAPSSAKVTS